MYTQQSKRRNKKTAARGAVAGPRPARESGARGTALQSGQPRLVTALLSFPNNLETG